MEKINISCENAHHALLNKMVRNGVNPKTAQAKVSGLCKACPRVNGDEQPIETCAVHKEYTK